MPEPQLSYDITIPVLDEEKRLPVSVPRLYEFLEATGINFTITIADNGSRDLTEVVTYELIKQYSKIKFVKIGKRGVGAALRASWDQSGADVIGYMDVDLATDIEHFREVATLFEGNSCDVVNGSRNLITSQVTNRSMLRTITSRGFNQILRTLLRVRFTDGMCGFKFLRRDVYAKLKAAGLKNDGWFFCTEFLYMAEKMGFLICEIPVKWADDKDSRVRLFRTIVYYLLEILKLRVRGLRELLNE